MQQAIAQSISEGTLDKEDTESDREEYQTERHSLCVGSCVSLASSRTGRGGTAARARGGCSAAAGSFGSRKGGGNNGGSGGGCEGGSTFLNGDVGSLYGS